MFTEYLTLISIIISIIFIYIIMMYEITYPDTDKSIKIHWKNVMLYDTLYFINGNFVTERNETVYWHDFEERIAIDYLHKILANHNISKQ